MPQPPELENPSVNKTPLCRPEIGIKTLLLDSKANYEQKYGKLPESSAQSRTEMSDIILHFVSPS